MSGTPRQYAFQHAGLDRAEHLREDPEGLQRHWAQARLLYWTRTDTLIFRAMTMRRNSRSAVETLPQIPAAASFLGLDESQVAWFALPAELAPIHCRH